MARGEQHRDELCIILIPLQTLESEALHTNSLLHSVAMSQIHFVHCGEVPLACLLLSDSILLLPQAVMCGAGLVAL